MAIIKRVLLIGYLSALLSVSGVFLWSWITGLEVYLQSLAFGLILVGWIMIMIRYRLDSVSSYMLSFGLFAIAVMVKLLNSGGASELVLRLGSMFLLVAVLKSIQEHHFSSNSNERENVGT